MLRRSTEMKFATAQRHPSQPPIWSVLCAALFAGIATLHAAAPTPEQIEFFENKIRPLLSDHCYECHSAKSKSIKGGLKMDTRDGLLKGGDTGPAIVPGDTEKSLLIKAVRYTKPDLQMPPKNKRLAPEQIAALETWVKMGAPDPRSTSPSTSNSQPSSAGKHWAFQPIHPPALPVVKNKRWAQSPIDAFVLAKLEAAKLDPSPATDKRTLIRRATFDLTGLPPTPAEADAFLADKSPGAYAKVIDRLLASPRYGERWARHWLDVARYGDVKGYIGVGVERRYPYSYTYRDYVIRAFNEDLPFDRFIHEQLAADQLNLGEDKRPLAAMGFLTLGRRFINNQQEIIDDRIDVTTRGLMGLTVTCARCHDHKYDPIPTKDYYSLYGVFASSIEPTDLPLIAKPAENASYESFEKELKVREAVVNKFREERAAQITSDLRAPAKIAEYLLAAHDAAKLDDGALRELAKQRELRPYFIERWRAFVGDTAKSHHPILGPWHGLVTLRANDFTNKTAAVLAPFTNAAPIKPVNPLVARAFATPPTSLKEAAQRYGALLGKTAPAEPTADKDEEALRQLLRAKANPLDAPIADFEKFVGRDDRNKLVILQKKVEEWKINSPNAPARAHSLADAPTPTEPVVFVRGNAGNRGPQVPRQFLEVIAGAERKPFVKGSGRLEMAQSITSTNNPLTARVIVNRIWMHHFGQGFVRTPSDFGLRADPPSHPELLDHLAQSFMAEGWSLKKLHRIIMLSATYQQASDDRADAVLKDSNNLLLWKKNRHRLEFEAMRDSLLFVSGQLDLTMGGKPVELTKDPFPVRRAVYAYIDRQNLPGLFRTFDFANPDTHSPMRFSTTVPQQALFWMNSALTTQQARHLAVRPELTSLGTDDAKVRWVYATLYQRIPTADEMKDARQFLQAAAAATPTSTNATGTAAISSMPSAWEQLVHVLLMANEFAFVD